MKILVIQQKMIGDVLTSSILFEALRKQFPGSKLHYLIQPHTIPVIENNPFIDKMVLFDQDSQKSPSHFFNFLKELKKQDYTHVIDAYAKVNSALMTCYSGAGERISYHKWYTSQCYSKTVKRKKLPYTTAGLAIENRMLLLQEISQSFPQEIKPKIYLRTSERESALEKLEKAGISLKKPLIMAGILGSSSVKTYPLKYMAAVLDYIVSTSNSQLLFNYIPKQKKEAQELFNLCSASTRRNIFLGTYGESLREFLAICSHCDALIGNEGGAVNMAKALDIPTFAIFSPQISKESWSIYEDGKKNVSVHLKDFNPTALEGKSGKELTKKAAVFYELLTPNLIFAALEGFLHRNLQDKKAL